MQEKLAATPLDGTPRHYAVTNGDNDRLAELVRLGLLPGSPTVAAIAQLQQLSIEDFLRLSGEYLDACALDNAPSTIEAKRDVFAKFAWYLKSFNHASIGDKEIRGFLSYIKTAHNRPDGRWGRSVPADAEAKRFREPASDRTVQYYFVYLKGFFKWATVDEELLLRDPCAKIKVKRPSKPCISPFSPDQVQALESVAAHSNFPKRDAAIIVFMFDTGLRAAELCNMKLSDLEFDKRGTGRVRVIGKGNKERIVPFGKKARNALRAYVSSQPSVPGMNIWISRNGPQPGDPLKPNGLRQLYERLGKAAHISGVRCSPHTMRHTFATTFLRNGGNLPTLQYLMGHEKLETTMVYLHIVDTDAENQHALYSPADTMD